MFVWLAAPTQLPHEMSSNGANGRPLLATADAYYIVRKT